MDMKIAMTGFNSSYEMDRRTKIIRLVALLSFIVAVGTIGYHLLLGWDWLDALYMTVITLTTVGYGEVRQMGDDGHLFTILLIITGFGVVAYTATTLATMVVETQFQSMLWRRRMQKKINNLSDHYIICGYGRTGSAVCEALSGTGISFVVVETRQEKAEMLNEHNFLVISGDASSDDTLERAGITRAKGLVATLGGDAENVYLVLSARQLNPNLTIVAWASSSEAEIKVRRAGADHVLSPYVMGGRRIASLLTTPHALEFFDHALFGKDQEIRLGEINIPAGSPLIENSLKGLGVDRDIGVIVIGVRRGGGKLQFNPSANTTFHEHDILIGIGSQEQFEKFRKLVGG